MLTLTYNKYASHMMSLRATAARTQPLRDLVFWQSASTLSAILDDIKEALTVSSGMQGSAPAAEVCVLTLSVLKPKDMAWQGQKGESSARQIFDVHATMIPNGVPRRKEGLNRARMRYISILKGLSRQKRILYLLNAYIQSPS